MINRVIYAVPTDERSTVLRVLLFKVFNRIETWQYLEAHVGTITTVNFDVAVLNALLDQRLSSGERLYSAAYIMPSPKLGATRKHTNHLRLLKKILADGTIDRLVSASNLEQLYAMLTAVPSFGRFLAFQFAIDLNYSPLYDFSEMDFVVAGPGARDGLAKCFSDTDGLSPDDVIRAVTESAHALIDQAGVEFDSLWGRPLQLIDCQNLFCELDKYARIVHPELRGLSGRTRIKQRYVPRDEPLAVGYPPKWGLGAAAIPSRSI